MDPLDDALNAFADTAEPLHDTQATPSFAMTKRRAPDTSSLDHALDAYAGREEKEQLRGSVALGAKQDAKQATKVLQLFGKTGLPQGFIERNQDFVEQESLKQNFNPDRLMKESPAFASWLAESPDHVAAVKHDAPTVSYLERQWRHIQAASESGPLMLELADLGNKSFDSTITPKDRARQAEIESRLQTLGTSAKEHDITGFFEGIPAAVVEQAPIFLRSLGGKAEQGAKGLVAGTAAGALVGSAAGPGGTAVGAIGGGTVVGLTGWRYGAAIEAGKIERGHALLDYEKLKDEQGNPLDSTTIKGLSLMAGAINGALEGLTGVEALANKLPGVKNIVRGGVKELLKTPTARGAILSMGKQVGDTMLTEGVTEALQMYVTKAGGVLAQWAVDGGGPVDVLGKIFSAENATQAIQEFRGGAQGGGGIATVMTTPGLIQDLRQVRQATQNQRAFEAMGQAAESSQFAKDLPDHLKKIIAEATKDGPVEQVYIPTDAFNTYFQGKGVDPRQVAAAITGNVEAYDQAIQTGQDLEIPTADYVSKLAGTEHNAFFSQELRTSLDTMNAREAAEWMQEQDAQEKAAAEQQGLNTAKADDPAAQVRQDITGQLLAAGFAPEVVEQYAGLIESRYTARAARRGLGESPLDLFNKNNLNVSRPVPEGLRQLGTTTELDALLNRLRVGDLPKPAEVYGQSLTEFLTEKGGIQNQGGELGEIATQPFKKKLIQQTGKTLDEAAQMAQEAGYLDERDIPKLLEAIDQESRGAPVYAVGRENAALLDVQHNLDSLKQYLESKGIDLRTASNQDVKKALGEAVQQTLPAVEGQTFAQADPQASKKLTLVKEAVRTVVVGAEEGIAPGLRPDLEAFGGSSDVAIVWGNARMGLQKIGQKRGADVVWKVLRAVALGAIERHSATKHTVVIQHEGTHAVLSLDEHGHQKTWLLTGWEEGRPDVPAEGRTPSGTTQQVPTFSRDMLGASLDTNLALSPDQGNGPSTLLQSGNQPKGSITFGSDSISIKLLEKADLSTFLHETGHLYLNELIEDATTAGTSDQLRTDLDTILKWMGLDVTSASGADAIKAAIQTQHHEQFARGWEAYAMEGQSPSQALREAFARFRQWMIQVYRSLTTAPLNVKLTKNVREGMDRLIATDEAIDAAAAEADVLPLFTDAVSAGMSQTQWQAYQDLVANASLTARETLQAKLMKQYQREQQAWWKEKREAMLATVTNEVNEEPEYIALAVLKTGKMPDGSEIPHGIPPMKLDKKGLADVFGKDFLKQMPKGLTAKDGMHHDAVAQLFGYSNGQDFIDALVKAGNKGPMIEAETDRRMREEYGDIRFDGTLAEEAKAAVLNEHQEAVIAAELKAINRKRREVAPFLKAANQEQQAAQRQGRDLLATMTPTLESVRETARKIMSRMALKHIQPTHYSITARQASRKATAALAKQDWVNAGHFKQQELLNLALYREAGIVKDRIESARDLAKGFFKADATLAKIRNVDLVNVGRAILAQYGFGTQTEKTAAEYLEPIQKYDPDLYSQWKPQMEALAARPLNYQALTVEEFTKLADDLEALWLLSRRTQQVKIDGQLLDRADVIDQLEGRLNDLGVTPPALNAGDPTTWEETKMDLLSAGSKLRRVVSWVEAMDGGNINGAFRRFIWQPIHDASVQFRTEKARILTRYADLIKTIEGTITSDIIPASELRQDFLFTGGKSALIHALLHTGNASNAEKFFKGYDLDASQWPAFLSRMAKEGVLTKAHMDYVQGVWDLLEELKPLTQKAHHEMYGHYFNEITASPVQTPWGEYRGGYVPATPDPNKSTKENVRQQQKALEQGHNSFAFPTAGRGATKTRVERYIVPLMVNLRTIPIHIDWALRFTYLEPRVKEVAKIVTNKQFSKSLDAMNPTVAKDMLVPWLQSAAQQTISTPGSFDKISRYLRSTVGAQIMVGNVVNALQQVTGFSLTLTKVKARYLRGGLATYLKGPSAMAEAIHAKSPYMAQRLTTQVMEIQSTIDDIILNPNTYQSFKMFAKRHGYFLQQGTQNVVDLITWTGAYDQSIAKGAGEKVAVRVADDAVIQTQGSFEPEVLSAFEKGTPFVRAFTMFYSYFNMQANLLGTEFQKVAQEMGLKKGAGRVFHIYVLGFLIPNVLAEIIVKSIGGFDPDDEDDYLSYALSVLFLSQIRGALAFFPGIGPVAMGAINYWNNKPYDDRIATSPVVTALESAGRAPYSAYHAWKEEGHSKRAVRDVLTLLGLVTGTPASALNRPVGYLADVYDGVATPENAVDVTRGLITGKDVNRKK